MHLVSCHRGVLQSLGNGQLGSGRAEGFGTGLKSWDQLLPGGFARGAVHELLGQQCLPLFAATVLARAALGNAGAIVWCDPEGGLYPPAVAAAGIPLSRLFLLRPKSPSEAVWAVGECLRCKGVSVTLAEMGRLSRIEARRLQLAAECGGGTGILLRPDGAASAVYAAASRWRVRPIPGEVRWQRWQIQLLHGHGGRVGQSVILEVCRETGHVRAFEAVGDRAEKAERLRA